ncbi:hypothetical protein Poli38472_007926 [Pythium oligandrum]|uniref:Uncharacterized protein n=1 Tax=Pythium oligandrum TaxID=41045 RepID=A0A8K1CLJ5_PYTOL|nr:hypothetical protein Poli38472_007926 [Pythium oligandrum]|eukprot:TMW65284.1 hypothetical protein Poli38472_007926 [Pythium oligandrum]
MTAFDVLFTKQAYRLNGEIFGLFMIKVSILFLGFLPILWSTSVTNRRIALKWTNPNVCSVEWALAVRFGLSGSIGQSVIYTQSPKSESRKSSIRAGPTLDDVCPSLSTKKSDIAVQSGLVVVPYEVARAGYVMISDDAMISLNDWFWFMMTTPLRFVLRRFVHFRIYVFNVTQSPLKDDSYTVRERASLCRVSDKRFDQVAWWRISLRRFR